MVTSIANLRFWLQLCNAASLPEAAALIQHFQANSPDKDELAKSFRDYNQELVTKVSRTAIALNKQYHKPNHTANTLTSAVYSYDIL